MYGTKLKNKEKCNAPHCQDTISKKISYVLLSIVMGRRRDLSDPRMDFFWRSIPQRLMWAFYNGLRKLDSKKGAS